MRRCGPKVGLCNACYVMRYTQEQISTALVLLKATGSIVSIVFRKIKILPFGSRKSTGYDIRLLILFWFEKMIHIHIASGSPAGCRYMAQSGTYEHQGTLPVRKSTDRFCTAFNLTVGRSIALLVRIRVQCCVGKSI